MRPQVMTSAPPETIADERRSGPAARPGIDAERLIAMLRRHEPALRKRGIGAMWLYGSVRRGEAGPASDVDLLIDIPADRRFSLFELGKVRVWLNELLAREVDLLIRSDLSPKFRRRTEPDLLSVF